MGWAEPQELDRLILMITLPLSSAIILTNLLIIVGITCNRQLHTTPNYFFLSLLVAAVCTGVALPFIPRMGLDRPLPFHACMLVHIFPNFLLLSFLFNLVMVHYERYVCIASPLHYSRFWVHRCFPAALLAVWMPPLLYASLPAFGWNSWFEPGPQDNGTNRVQAGRDGNCSVGECAGLGGELCSYRQVFPKAFIYVEVYGLLLPGIICIAAMTARVLCLAHKQLRDICRLQRGVGQDGGQAREQRLNLRYAKCVAVVSLTFLVCWVPYVVSLHVSVARFHARGTVSSSSNIVLSCVGIGSMAVIPVILGLANRQYTEPIRALLGKLRNRCSGRLTSGDGPA